MSAEILREAASLIRSRAEAATSGPWVFHPASSLHDDAAGWIGAPGLTTPDGIFVASVSNTLDGLDDGGHIASWHPAVALAVADWLDECAQFIEEEPDRTRDDEDRAFAVALTYLGRES